MNNLLYHEIFELFEKTDKRADKIEVLRKHSDRNFISFLEYAFNPSIVFDVEIPDYKPSKDPAGLNYVYLHNEIAGMYRFIVGHPKRSPNLESRRQKILLLQVLEGLHAEEASLLIKCIGKDLKIPFLTKKLVKEAFPNINIGE